MFHLLRHASHAHVGRVLTGRLDGAPLTPAGRSEALALARHMGGLKLDALYASPRLRARETGEIVARVCGIAAERAEELDEIEFGHWSGRSFDELELEPAWRRWNEERDTAATPAGETMGAVAGRMGRLLERLRLRFPGGAVALVSHSDVIKATLCRHLGWPFQHVHEFEIGPASMTTLAFDGERAALLARNIRPLPADAGVPA